MTLSNHLRRNRVSTSLIFFIDGFVLAMWATNIPGFKKALSLSDSELGWALSAFAIGTMTVMGLAGAVVARIGTKAAMVVGGLTMAAALPLCAVATSVWQLAGAIFCIGAFTSILDVAMNTHGTMIEAERKRPMMSSFHAIFSIGGLCGASSVAVLLSDSFGMEQCMWLACISMIVVVCLAAPFLDKVAVQPPNGVAGVTTPKLLAWPNRALMAVALLTILTMFIERIVTDWSSLYMIDVTNVAISDAAFAYGAFSLAMAVGRLAGDASIARWGGDRVMMISGVVGGLGVALMVAIPTALAGNLGFLFVGLGLANMAPMLYSRASRIYPGSPAIGVALNGTIGYAGYFLAPPLMGALSDASGLRVAMIVAMIAFVLLSMSQWRSRGSRRLAGV